MLNGAGHRVRSSLPSEVEDAGGTVKEQNGRVEVGLEEGAASRRASNSGDSSSYRSLGQLGSARRTSPKYCRASLTWRRRGRALLAMPQSVMASSPGRRFCCRGYSRG
jgi:hypothetical protein